MKALKVFKYIGFGILGIGFVIAVIFGVQALWNWLIPRSVPRTGSDLLADGRIVSAVEDTSYGNCSGWLK